MAIRIIPCLDIQDGRVVKGVQFKDIKDAGDAIGLAQSYDTMGASELMLLNIGSSDNNKGFIKLVRSISKNVTLPIIAGGGINKLDDIKAIKDAGAERVTLGTIAIKEPSLIKRAAYSYGSDSIVVSIDAKKTNENKWSVFIRGGRENTNIDVVDWAFKVFKLGAGEILLNSMDRDGAKKGYDIELIKSVTDRVEIPVIASGGAGLLEHFSAAIEKGGAHAVLAASLFHYGNMKIQDLKDYLIKRGIKIK